MAARAPAHLTLVYPEECNDERLLVARTSAAADRTAPFSVVTREVGHEREGDGGVWFLADDESGTWRSLRQQILEPPCRMRDAAPHITIVHPRTSNQGRSALESLAHAPCAEAFTLDEIVYTDTSEAGMRVLERFPLRARISRVVGAILRRHDKVLLCLRSRHRRSYPGVWDIPGGHVEESETSCDALKRELVEELGIVSRSESIEPWSVHRIGATELSVFLVDRWDGEPENRAPIEHEDIRWVGVEELAALPLAHPSFSQLLARALRSPLQP